jgi:hypothetical protein
MLAILARAFSTFSPSRVLLKRFNVPSKRAVQTSELSTLLTFYSVLTPNTYSSTTLDLDAFK